MILAWLCRFNFKILWPTLSPRMSITNVHKFALIFSENVLLGVFLNRGSNVMLE